MSKVILSVVDQRLAIKRPHQDLLSKILEFRQIFFIPALIVQFICLSFHQSLKWQISILSLRRVTKLLRKIRDQSAHFQASRKSLSDACFAKSPISRIPIQQSSNVGLDKLTAHNIACQYCQKNVKMQRTRENEMKGNGNKCHLIINKQGSMNLKIRNINIENSNCEKRLGVKVIINSTSLNTWME